MKYLSAFTIFLLPLSAFAAKPILVPIHFFEALAPRDTTSSDRFQKEYDSAIQTAKTLASPRLSKCGYQIEEKTVFYSATDALEAHERGQVSEKAAAWMIVGPRRSNHYALLTKGAPNTPSVSTMASSQEIVELAPLHLSIAPSNQVMAGVAVRETKSALSKIQNTTYVSIVSEDCVSCIDFTEHFDKAARPLNLKHLAEYKIQGETPDLKKIVEAVSQSKPAIVLIPNYSKVTAQIVAAIHKVVPDSFFVGGDGWGDSRFGFVQDAADLNGTKGITVRGFPTTDAGLAAFPLGKILLASKDASVTKPGSATALAILKILDGTTDLLCKAKPKTAAEFKSVFLKAGSAAFRSPWGVSIYRLKDGDIKYERIARRAGK